MLFDQPEKAIHPEVWLRQDPVGPDGLHEQVAWDAQLWRDNPLRPLLGSSLDAPLNQLSVVVDIVGYWG